VEVGTEIPGRGLAVLSVLHLELAGAPGAEAGPGMTDISSWPVSAGIEYDEDGPALLCDAWVEVRRAGGTWVVPCKTAITGMTWGELEASLREHIEHSVHPHHESPAATLSREAGEAAKNRRKK
jgi:hypothetical protein